jgi:septum site-determining protein MinD
LSRTISIHSFRGGTGKTNFTANVAALAVRAGRRVAVVDTDIQSPGIHVLFGWDAGSAGRTLNDYLWDQCAIEDAAHPAAVGEVGPGLYLVPARLSTGAITRVLREGFDVGKLNDGFRRLQSALRLDALLIDTHPGLNPETLLSVAVSDAMVILLRPDQQDYQGTSVTVDVARRLEVPDLGLVVNKVPDGVDRSALAAEVTAAYDCPVLAVLPHSDAVMRLSSAGLFAVRFPDHPVTAQLAAIATRLVPGGHAEAGA